MTCLAEELILLAKDWKYLELRLLLTTVAAKATGWSSSVTELGREESEQRSWWRRRRSGAEDAEEEELPLESREAVVLVSVEEEEVEEEARRRVLTMEMRGERWSGRSWPL